MAIPWTPALAIGVPELDHQHQELFLRIERLVDGVSRANQADIESLLDDPPRRERMGANASKVSRPDARLCSTSAATNHAPKSTGFSAWYVAVSVFARDGRDVTASSAKITASSSYSSRTQK